MAGAYLDSKGSLFLRLSWRHNKLTVWHFKHFNGDGRRSEGNVYATKPV